MIIVSYKVYNPNTQPIWEEMEMQRSEVAFSEQTAGQGWMYKQKSSPESYLMYHALLKCFVRKKIAFQGKPARTIAPEIKHDVGN